MDILLQKSNRSLSSLLIPLCSVRYSCILPFIPIKILRPILWLVKIFGFNQIKVKTNGEDDEMRLKLIRNILGSEVEIRIDGNSIYNFQSFLKNMPYFKKYKISWIEQPFLKERHNKTVAQFTQRDIPLMAMNLCVILRMQRKL